MKKYYIMNTIFLQYYLVDFLHPPRKKKFNVPKFHHISSEYLYTFKLAMKEIKCKKGAYYTKADIPSE